MATKRRENSGWEYIVKRANEPKPFSIVLAGEVEGDACIRKLEAICT